MQVGESIGPYRIVSRLGEGGMGEVYRSIDTRLGRAVALKVIAPGMVGDEDSRRRFETEARAASALNHPAIVTLYDIGELDGVAWLAMELVEGRTLREVLADGPMPIRQAWSIAKQIADGLAAAHAKGIVHRDLKPDNVMVTPEGAVKILDFGLARQTAAPAFDASSTETVTNPGTVAGTILGTVGYMSPEQATGRSVDFRSDQFSFGAVVYELLTGRRAFSGTSAIETLAAVVRDEPARVALWRDGISEAFERVIDRCLEKQPARRFESTRALSAALEALEPESTSGAAAVRNRPAVGTVVLRHRWWAAIMVAAILAVAAVIAIRWNQRERGAGPAITSVAVLPFVNTARDAGIDYISDGLTDGLIDHLSRAESLKVMARATVMRFKDQHDPREAARALGVGAVVTGGVSRRGNQVVIAAELIHGATGERLWGQTFDRPMAELMQVQDSIVLSIAEGLRLRLTGEQRAQLGGFGTSNAEAYELFLKGRFLLQRDTEEDDLEARRLFMQATEKDPTFVDAHLAVASTYARSIGSGFASPEEAGPGADAALAKAAALDPNNTAVRVAMAHRRFTMTHDWAAAERDYRALMNDPAILRTVQYHPIALFFVAIGRPDEAAALVERALAVDPGNLESRVMLGNFLLQAGRLDEARRVYEAMAAENTDDPRPLFGSAEVHKRRGDFALAAATRRKAHQLDGDDEGADAFANVTSEASYLKAEMAVAQERLSLLQELAKERYVEPLDIARLHAQVGNREQALAGLERAADGTSIGLIMLKADQAWDSVRADPRFAAVVRRIGIP